VTNETTPIIDLTIYLAKDGIEDFSKLIVDSASLKQFVLRIGAEIDATLFVKNQRANIPKWASFFEGFVSPDEFGRNASTAAVLRVNAEGKTFLITFGVGRHLIDSAYIETNFGLRVALNTLDPLSIRSIDKSSLESQPIQLREQTGKATELQYFGIDVERDLLRAVTGTPKQDVLGHRLSGMDALKLNIRVRLDSLGSLLSILASAFSSQEYKSGPFAWVDHIGQVKDIALADRLDHLLIAKINSGDFDNIWLSVPEIIDWNTVVGFRYSMAKRSPTHYDIRLPDLIQAIGQPEIAKRSLTGHKIFCVDADDLSVFERPAYFFIYAELLVDGLTYLLNNGKWYQVQQDYASSVNNYFSAVPRYNQNLPVYEDETEGDYNARVASMAPNEFVLMDKKMVYLKDAASPVEACDLYRHANEFIHVKRYGGSSVLSHLFNQGLVSGELFQMQREYRMLLNKKLPTERNLIDVDVRPAPRAYRVVYAIISESDAPLTIPFFSKISLKHCTSRLEAIGFDVALAKISVTEQKRITKKYAIKRLKST